LLSIYLYGFHKDLKSILLAHCFYLIFVHDLPRNNEPASFLKRAHCYDEYWPLSDILDDLASTHRPFQIMQKGHALLIV